MSTSFSNSGLNGFGSGKNMFLLSNQELYYLNHRSWWDGLIPFLLNEYLFHQKARAPMEEKQIKKYPFFRKIGAFSINRETPGNIFPSLRYAVRSMEREHA